jgi:hypothetical protein
MMTLNLGTYEVLNRLEGCKDRDGSVLEYICEHAMNSFGIEKITYEDDRYPHGMSQMGRRVRLTAQTHPEGKFKLDRHEGTLWLAKYPDWTLVDVLSTSQERLVVNVYPEWINVRFNVEVEWCDKPDASLP